MDILEEISALVLDYVEPEELFNELLRRDGMDVWMALEDGENLSVRIMVDDSGDYRHLSVPFAELVKDRVSALDDCLESYAIPTKKMAELLRMAAATLEYELKQRGVG